MTEGDRPFSLRRCDPRQERAVLIEAVTALQDFERAVEPRLPEGSAVAARYVDAMVQRCMAFRGAIFLAERRGQVAGFCCVLARVTDGALAEGQRTYASLGELFIYPAFRGQGAARALLSVAEAFAREGGSATLRVQVLAANALVTFATRNFSHPFSMSNLTPKLRKPLEKLYPVQYVAYQPSSNPIQQILL